MNRESTVSGRRRLWLVALVMSVPLAGGWAATGVDAGAPGTTEAAGSGPACHTRTHDC